MIFSKTPTKFRWGGFNRFCHVYDNIISLDNLLEAWKEFKKGKKSRKDVQSFERNLMANIIGLHQDLALKRYKHSDYESFNISDPKPRNIHKAAVRDRLLHHAIYRILYPFFDRVFIHDSYSCRLEKGNHKAINRFREFAYIESKNHTRTIWILKCDIRKFFATIDHVILKNILRRYIPDNDIYWLLGQIIDSFHPIKKGMGLPLGNLTSQLLVNIYMNEFDQFVKRELKIKSYIRFADDFIILSSSKSKLEDSLGSVIEFLDERLKLELHPDKVFIKTVASGLDFLGWVNFTEHRVLRTVTKRKMLKNLSEKSLTSYLGMLEWGNAHKLRVRIKTCFTL